MNNQRERFFHRAVMGGVLIAGFSVCGAWSGITDRTDAMPPPPKFPPSGRVAPQRRGGMDGDYRIVAFSTLGGFPFTAADQVALTKGQHTHDWESKVPEDVKALKNKKVTVQGYVMPVDIDFERKIIKTFVLVPHLMNCCFGGSSPMNMWIFVSTDSHTKDNVDFENTSDVVRVYGTLDLGERLDEDVGQSLYRLKADRLSQPKNPEL